MSIYKYNRNFATEYAIKWAKTRNNNYYNFDKLGGDCTNFISQCIYAGCNQMNYTPVLGWFYNNANSRSPAWTGVEFLYNFLTANFNGVGNKFGPFGKLVNKSDIEIGDIIQLSFNGTTFNHSLIVSKIINNEIYICAHSTDSLNKPLSHYSYNKIRFIKILGYRK